MKKHIARMSIRKWLVFLILVISPLFNFPPFVVVETPVEHPVTLDFREAANNKAFSPFLQAG
jgi:hypothetical protein